jgi:hypothetical protein
MELKSTALKTYFLLGRGLMICTGGILGFTLGGPLAALPGVLAGALAAELIKE